jgi:hypothetical protein
LIVVVNNDDDDDDDDDDAIFSPGIVATFVPQPET